MYLTGCVKEREMVRKERNKNENIKHFENFECLPNGNYKPTQNVGATSITVSDMGYQIFKND